MRKATIYPVLFCLLATFGGITLQADITYEMKSSLSGIPFLKMFEMYQTTCVGILPMGGFQLRDYRPGRYR